MNHSFNIAATNYNNFGGEVLYAARQDARAKLLAVRDAIDAGQRSAEVEQARQRIAKRGY